MKEGYGQRIKYRYKRDEKGVQNRNYKNDTILVTRSLREHLRNNIVLPKEEPSYNAGTLDCTFCGKTLGTS